LSESFKMNEQQFKCTNYHICSRNASFTDHELKLHFCGTLCHLGHIELNSKESFERVVNGKKLPDFKVSMEYPEMTLKITKKVNGKYIRIETTHFMLLKNDREDYTFATDLPKQMKIVSVDRKRDLVEYQNTYTRLIVPRYNNPRNYDHFIILYKTDPSGNGYDTELDLIIVNPNLPDLSINFFPTLKDFSTTVVYHGSSKVETNAMFIEVELSREKEYYILRAYDKTKLILYERSLQGGDEEAFVLSKYSQDIDNIMVLKVPPEEANIMLQLNVVYGSQLMTDTEGKIIINKAKLAVLVNYK
jgi:hypothetical protein